MTTKDINDLSTAEQERLVRSLRNYGILGQYGTTASGMDCIRKDFATNVAGKPIGGYDPRWAEVLLRDIDSVAKKVLGYSLKS